MKMITWQYKVLCINNQYPPNVISEKLNAWGMDGWELVQILPSYVVFKRPYKLVHIHFDESK